MCTTPASHVHDGERCQTEHVEAPIQEYAPHVKYIAQRLACRLPASVCLDEPADEASIYFRTQANGRYEGERLGDVRLIKRQ